MEQLAHFVSKAFEEKPSSDDGDGAQGDDLENSKNSPVSMDLSQRNISPKPDRVSPKSEAEKKENLKNVVDVLTNSQRRIMENIYQKLDFRNKSADATPSDASATEPPFASNHKTSVMDIANLIGEQKNSKRIEFNFLGARDRIQLTLENSANGLAEQSNVAKENPESPASEYSRMQKQHSRGSSVSPIIDPEDSRSSLGSGPKREPQDGLKSRNFVGEEDSKTGRN